MRLTNSVYIYLYTDDIEASIGFYRDDLGLFDVFEELGPKQLIMEFKNNDSICIMLNKVDSKYESKQVVFTLNIDDLDKVHKRLLHRESLRGATFFCDPEKEIFEYPLERNFAIDDPDGNRLILSSGLNFEPNGN